MSAPPVTTEKQNPVEVPLYTPWDVARYLRVPVWTALALAGWGHFPPDPEWFFHHFCRRWPPHAPFEDADLTRLPDEFRRISFRRFADLYVRAFVARNLLEFLKLDATEASRQEAIYEAVWRVFAHPPQDVVLFGQVLAEEGFARLIEAFSRGADSNAERARKSLALCLDRVQLEGAQPRRLYPFSRIPVENSPRAIVMDPCVRFGRPTIAGSGVPTDNLFERHQAGDSIAELAADYGIPPEQVEEAIRYEAIPVVPVFPFG
jgi:uncharacterized protein (DUF433 family)